MADFRLRHRRLPRSRSAVRHPRRLRPPVGEGACAGPEGGDRPGAQPHLGRARVVPRKPRGPRQPEVRLVRLGRCSGLDGTPPNNWLSIFGGVARQWEPRRGQYFLHNFLASQPDPDFHKPGGARGAAGQREVLARPRRRRPAPDAINFCFHDARLRDNPPKPPELRGPRLQRRQPVRVPVPLAQQHATGEPGFAELRALMDRYGDVAALGEISSEDSLATMARIRRRRAPAHGLQLRACSPTTAARPTCARRWRRSKRRCRTAGRAGRCPTTTCAAR